MPTNQSVPQVETARALVRLARLIERSTGELSLAHYRVLSAVADGDERASRMATRLALGKPAISAAVEALCRRGLLVRDDVQGDQRATSLRLTAEGADVLAVAEDSIVQLVTQVIDRTPEPAVVLQALTQLGAALDEIAEERLAARIAADHIKPGT